MQYNDKISQRRGIYAETPANQKRPRVTSGENLRAIANGIRGELQARNIGGILQTLYE